MKKINTLGKAGVDRDLRSIAWSNLSDLHQGFPPFSLDFLVLKLQHSDSSFNLCISRDFC